ncbi:DUF190 domain-containing protein [uncultured Pseudodesulfovibrio sp.]|uniref:DUF190 domain-containing protein n=1 Tax=uncultured Pseudodesulfovibrio sp. TaxID=2035858 RepID=UPI0029C64C0E|nr:DUF190 domain-containing protein [uncultured Pseudodesulfovibrio sp.]
MMKGNLVTFFTQQSRTFEGISLAKWIVEEARKLGVGGATLMTGQEGFGHDGRFHSDSYFDLEDQPLQVSMALTFKEYENLMVRLEESHICVFYTKSEIEFGFTSEH